MLRKNQTLAEKRFWNIVRKRKILGFRFLRQKPILSYIVDFYCAKLKLVIEIDGDIHNESKEADMIRTNDLETLGIKVIRFTNHQVTNQLPSVIEQLRIEITSHRELPSLIFREGLGMGPD